MRNIFTNTFSKAMNANTFVMPHANIMMYTGSQYFCIKKYRCDPLIVPTLISRQHAILPACWHDGAYMYTFYEYFFQSYEGEYFVIPHAKIMMYTCPEYFHIKKYSYDPVIVPTLISSQDGLLPACRHDGTYILNITQSVPMPTCHQK